MYVARSLTLTPALAARNRLVEDNIGLAGFVVNKMRRTLAVQQLGNDEAVQVAHLALIRAAERFDPARCLKFSTYAVRSIETSILDAAKDDAVIHVPKYVFNVKSGVRYRADAERAQRLETLSPTRKRPYGLHPESQRDTTADDNETREELAAAVSRLNVQQRAVLDVRFVKGLTLKDAGDLLGLSKERIRQIQDAAVAELRAQLN